MIGFKLASSKLNDPQTTVVGATPPPQRATLPLALASKKQSPPLSGIGSATGKIKATNKTFEDHWVFDITVRSGKLTKVREYIDTQALARASAVDASSRRAATK